MGTCSKLNKLGGDGIMHRIMHNAESIKVDQVTALVPPVKSTKVYKFTVC